jgi:diguanylate cyclase (GGDEF)-like protein
MTQPGPIQVLLVEDNLEDARRLARMLRLAAGGRFRLQRTRRLREAQRCLLHSSPDVALVDLSLPDAHGSEAVHRIQHFAPSLPLIVLSDRENDALAADLLQQGAQDFLVKDELTDGHLSRALCHAIARHRLQVSLRSLSLIDELTGLHNRRGFVTLAENRLRLAVRQGLRSSLVFVDVDSLKYINDTFGHREGDRALQKVAEALRDCFRESDIVARIGGDEFCALLTDASQSEEMIFQARLSRALGDRNGRSEGPHRVSVSMGIVEVRGPYELEEQLARADARMYRQKRGKPPRIPAARPLTAQSQV